LPFGAAATAPNSPPIAFVDTTRAAQRSPLALFEAISRGVVGTAMSGFAQLSIAKSLRPSCAASR
jgi:high-affinity iron transporter